MRPADDDEDARRFPPALALPPVLTRFRGSSAERDSVRAAAKNDVARFSEKRRYGGARQRALYSFVTVPTFWRSGAFVTRGKHTLPNTLLAVPLQVRV